MLYRLFLLMMSFLKKLVPRNQPVYSASVLAVPTAQKRRKIAVVGSIASAAGLVSQITSRLAGEKPKPEEARRSSSHSPRRDPLEVPKDKSIWCRTGTSILRQAFVVSSTPDYYVLRRPSSRRQFRRQPSEITFFAA